MCLQLIELLSNAANEAQILGVRVDQRRPNHLHATKPRTTDSTALTHEQRHVPQGLSHQDRFTFPKVQAILPPQGRNLRSIGSLRDRDPQPVSTAPQSYTWRIQAIRVFYQLRLT